MGQNLYAFSLYRNPDLASTAAVQAKDTRASLMFVGDLNSHQQEGLGFTTKNRHGVAAFDSATVSGCNQLVVGPTNTRGGTLGDDSAEHLLAELGQLSLNRLTQRKN